MSDVDKPTFVREFNPGQDREERLAKRFYEAACARVLEDGVAVMLDERELKTPLRNPVRLSSQALGEAVAAEWAAQGERINPSTMPRTRIVTTAIDRVSDDATPALDEIVSYAGTDLTCYRADDPASLVAQQAKVWDPLLAWLETTLGTRLATTSGIIHVSQEPTELEKLRGVMMGLDPVRLTALHTLVTIAGSTVIGLAVLHGELDAEQGFAASRVDEIFQAAQWGEDAEAAERTKAHKAEFDAAADVLRLLD